MSTRDTGRAGWVGIAVLAALSVASFADVLFWGGDRVLSRDGGDLATQFVHWRRFGFDELARGNLALWNPHLFSGVPFFGGFQSALLYPPNWLYLVLPLPLAINSGIALHAFLTAAFMHLWARSRGLHPLACLFAGVLVLFCGPHFAHVFPGHLSNLCAMPWVVLLFVALDGVLERPTPGRAWLGATATALLLLAGHPQYVFYAALAAAVWCGLRLLRGPDRGRTVVALAAIAAGGVALAAAQLVTGVAELAASARGAGLSPAFAGRYSFPPENLLTLVAPQVLGSVADRSYWGAGNYWEMSLFFSVTGLWLAVYGAAASGRGRRRFGLVMIGILFVLALGRHTPLFALLHDWLPGFASFRGNSKFVYPLSLFAVLLSAVGLDRLWAVSLPSTRSWPIALAGAAVVLAGAAGAVQLGVPTATLDGWWFDLVKWLQGRAYAGGEPSLLPRFYDDLGFVTAAAERAARSLAQGAVLLGLGAGLLALAHRARRLAAAGAVALALAELVVFAWPLRPTFDLQETLGRQGLLAAHVPAGTRMFTLSNGAMGAGALDAWGIDPAQLDRYDAFVKVTQGFDPDGSKLALRQVHPLFALLRITAARLDSPAGSGSVDVRVPFTPLPQVLLVRQHRVLASRDALFRALFAVDFDPRREVLLEAAPVPAPGGEPLGEHEGARVVSRSTDTVEIEAHVAAPAILLVTDAYHPFWRAESLPGSTQETYTVMPADYVVRAVPLAAGAHRLRLHYAPPGLSAGLAVSGVSALVWLAVGALLLRARVARARIHRSQGAGPTRSG